jgi:CO/xanthine dehydrogenase FAD-binding subunit
MKPPPFDYHAPRALDEALALLERHGDEAKILAGGQSLIPMMNMRLASPGVLVDINRIPDLTGIGTDNGTVTIGALTRHRSVERSEGLAGVLPVLPEAVSHIGHVTIRNRGTVGGSLVHCDPAAEISTVGLALDMSVVATSPAGSRTIPISELLIGPFSTSVRGDEILTQIRIPKPRPGTGAAFVELARTHGNFAVASACAVLTIADGVITDAAVSLGGVAATPVRSGDAGKLLIGLPPGDELFRHAADAIDSAINPATDVQATADYRRQVAKVLVRRALDTAARRASQGAQQ